MNSTPSNPAGVGVLREAAFAQLLKHNFTYPNGAIKFAPSAAAVVDMMVTFALSLPLSGAAEGGPVDVTGEMWVAGRDAFVREADRFAKADRYEAASVIADRAPEKIYAAMLASSPQSPDRVAGESSPEVKALCDIHSELLAARADGGFIDPRGKAWEWSRAMLAAATKLERLERLALQATSP